LLLEQALSQANRHADRAAVAIPGSQTQQHAPATILHAFIHCSNSKNDSLPRCGAYCCTCFDSCPRRLTYRMGIGTSADGFSFHGLLSFYPCPCQWTSDP